MSLLATLIGISAAVAILSYVGPIEEEPALGCLPSEGPIEATVSGEPTAVHTSATPTSDPKGLLLRGCQLQVEGYCIGAVHQDAIEEQVFDTRWLILSDDQGLVPAGRTVGVTPADARRSCAGAVPPPEVVAFRSPVLDDANETIAVAARAPRAAFVGFAFRRPDGQWTRLGWDTTPEDDQPLNAPAPAGAAPGLEIAAVACIAFQRSSRSIRRAKLDRGRTDATELPLVTQPTADRPEQAACDAAVPPPAAG